MKTLAIAVAALALSLGAAFAQNGFAQNLAQSDNAGAIEVAHAWAPATEGELTNSAVYMTLIDQGAEPDELVAASSPVARKLELHVFDVANGVYGMHRVDAIAVTPGATATVLAPGGAHVMLEGLTRPLRAGETFPLTLTFKNAGALQVDVRVESPHAVAADASGKRALRVSKTASSGPEWPAR